MPAQGEQNEEILGAGALLLEAVLWSNSIAGGVVSVLIGLTLQQLVPEAKLPWWIASAVLILLLILVGSLIRALQRSVEQARRVASSRPHTEIRHVAAPFQPYNQARCVLIVRWSESSRLESGGAVRISLAEEKHERPLGYGTVRERQSDGCYVVTLDQTHEGVEDIIKRLLQPESGGLLAKLRLNGTIIPAHLDSVRQASLNPGSPRREERA